MVIDFGAVSRIVGPPGCGKTTWLSRQIRLAWKADHRIMVCSLTNAAAKEVAGRDLPLDSAAIGTLHSHAYRSINAGRLEIADDPKHLSEWNEAHPQWALSGGRSIDEDNTAAWGQESEADQLCLDYHNMRARMVRREAWRASTHAFAQVWEAWKREQGLWDFTDLLESALASSDEAPGSPTVIFADEAQDFSQLELALLEKWGQAAGRLVVVGDPWQSLYEWRGADADAVLPTDAIDRVLHQSYRVPVAVHAAAMRWIERMPGYSPIDYRPTEIEGSVAHCDATYAQPKAAADLIERSLDAGKSVMYLAAIARMLTPMLAELRRRGVPFANKWRLREGAWNPLQEHKGKVSAARRLAAFLRLGEEGIWSRDDVLLWCKAMKGGKKLEALVGNLPDGSVDLGIWEALVGDEPIESSMAGNLEWYLAQQLAARRAGTTYPCAVASRALANGSKATTELQKEPKVTVGTIHSVKGGEADVVILCPDVSVPGLQEWQSGDNGKAAIFRLFYVGMTRAKKGLHIMQPLVAQRGAKLL